MPVEPRPTAAYADGRHKFHGIIDRLDIARYDLLDWDGSASGRG